MAVQGQLVAMSEALHILEQAVPGKFALGAVDNPVRAVGHILDRGCCHTVALAVLPVLVVGALHTLADLALDTVALVAADSLAQAVEHYVHFPLWYLQNQSQSH